MAAAAPVETGDQFRPDQGSAHAKLMIETPETAITARLRRFRRNEASGSGVRPSDGRGSPPNDRWSHSERAANLGLFEAAKRRLAAGKARIANGPMLRTASRPKGTKSVADATRN